MHINTKSKTDNNDLTAVVKARGNVTLLSTLCGNQWKAVLEVEPQRVLSASCSAFTVCEQIKTNRGIKSNSA